MFLSYSSLGLFCVGVAIVWFWHDSLQTRDIANAAAMAACVRMGLQFLDGTAAFSHLRLTRVAGRIQLRRTYVFDYTSQSIERRQGFAILLGKEVEYVGFAPEHTAAAASPLPSNEPAPEERQRQPFGVGQDVIDVPNNVLDLNEHRTRRLKNSLVESDSQSKGDSSN